ncbi:MAG: hypothetical protein HZB46_17015 [Solirubrobacterales bacterium]|nr:hypothetical protein [Solirubrobacterales bacterium]
MGQRLPHLLGLALAAGLLVVAAAVPGLGSGLVLLSPALVLLVPPLAGRHLGEDSLARLAARRFAPRRPPAALAVR